MDVQGNNTVQFTARLMLLTARRPADNEAEYELYVGVFVNVSVPLTNMYM